MKNVNRTNPLPLNERFATRAQFFAPSPIRAVFEMEMDEGVISLAGRQPRAHAPTVARNHTDHQ